MDGQNYLVCMQEICGAVKTADLPVCDYRQSVVITAAAVAATIMQLHTVTESCRPEMCGRRHFGVRVRPRPQSLRPRPQESVDKRPRPRPHMSVNGVRSTDVKYSSTEYRPVLVRGEGPHGR